MLSIEPKHFELDRNNLEVAVWQQSSLYDYYGQLATDAKKTLDDLNSKLEYIMAEKRLEIKAQAEESKKKFTVDDINAMVLLNGDVRSTKQEILNAQHEYNSLNVAVKAMEHKRDMIQVLARITLSKSYNLSDTLDSETRDQVYSNAVTRNCGF